jgi:hypothetical protein
MAIHETIASWIDGKLRANATIQGLLQNVLGFNLFYESEGEQPPLAYVKFHTLTLADSDKDMQLQSDTIECEISFLSHSAVGNDFKQVRLMADAIYETFNALEDGEHYKTIECTPAEEVQFFDANTKRQTFEAAQTVSFLYIK